MSRSYKKIAAGGICSCLSEKEDKRIWHGRLRSANRLAIKRLLQFEKQEEDNFPHIRQVSNPWSMMKDGKVFYIRNFVYTRKLLQYLKTQEAKRQWSYRFICHIRSILFK